MFYYIEYFILNIVFDILFQLSSHYLHNISSLSSIALLRVVSNFHLLSHHRDSVHVFTFHSISQFDAQFHAQLNT